MDSFATFFTSKDITSAPSDEEKGGSGGISDITFSAVSFDFIYPPIYINTTFIHKFVRGAFEGGQGYVVLRLYIALVPQFYSRWTPINFYSDTSLIFYIPSHH